MPTNPSEIFDQERPRSVKARRLDEAFAGCDEWETAPPSPRRIDALDVAPWLTPAERSRPDDGLPRAA
jgi:hypothetical protein